jgi:hypothetical protein
MVGYFSKVSNNLMLYLRFPLSATSKHSRPCLHVAFEESQLCNTMKHDFTIHCFT